MTKMRWTTESLAAYKAAGEEMKQRGYRAMREVKDPDCQTVLTFWGSAEGTVIQQTWTQLGDVVFWRASIDAEDACAQRNYADTAQATKAEALLASVGVKIEGVCKHCGSIGIVGQECGECEPLDGLGPMFYQAVTA